jgi:hypothetical protein
MNKQKEATEMVTRMHADLAALRERRIATSINSPMVFTTLSDRIDSLYGALQVDAIEYPAQPNMIDYDADVWESSVSVNSRRGSKQ